MTDSPSSLLGYVTGRTTSTEASPLARPETIDETTEMVGLAGGDVVAVRTDHADRSQVTELIERIDAERGRLDILVNDVWGGDPLTERDANLWEHDLENGISLVRNAVETHLITSWHAARLLIETPGSLIVEVTDGVSDRYRGSLFYDLADLHFAHSESPYGITDLDGNRPDWGSHAPTSAGTPEPSTSDWRTTPCTPPMT